MCNILRYIIINKPLTQFSNPLINQVLSGVLSLHSEHLGIAFPYCLSRLLRRLCHVTLRNKILLHNYTPDSYIFSFENFLLEWEVIFQGLLQGQRRSTHCVLDCATSECSPNKILDRKYRENCRHDWYPDSGQFLSRCSFQRLQLRSALKFLCLDK